MQMEGDIKDELVSVGISNISWNIQDQLIYQISAGSRSWGDIGYHLEFSYRILARFSPL